ncbi:MAG: hypothetical protein MUP71_14655 [Candidatus Aminicenantes bacterium]|nr:hypothetical protein [Candidatus Aminicenantes bacterium]
MTVNLKSHRRILLAGAVLFAVVAFVVAAGVIPVIRADTFPAAAPLKAAAAFWVNVVFNLLVAASLVFVSLRSVGRNRLSTTLLVLLVLLVLLFAFALFDAAQAYQAHGPAMRTSSILLFLCSAGDLLALALVITAMFLSPKRTRD